MTASVIAYDDCRKKYPNQKVNQPKIVTPGLEIAKEMLGPLCDLQLVTSMAVLIAGLVQWPEITYYHEQFVLQYWWLTINSCWVTRNNYNWDDGEGESEQEPSGRELREQEFRDREEQHQQRRPRARHDFRNCESESWRLTVRRYFLAMGGMVLLREERHWDPFSSGFCYIDNDVTSRESFWFWHAGVALYALVLFLTLIPMTKEWLIKLRRTLHEISKDMGEYCAERFRLYSPSWSLVYIGQFGFLLLLSTTTVLFWCGIQFLALWSYGQGYYALEFCSMLVCSPGDFMTLWI